jgi:catechol 2,3-dioxygenase-like lactoylglutathione lyase family enzyme
MLTTSNAYSGFAVDDLDAARHFYGDKLGVRITDGPMGVLILHIGDDRPTLVYPKPDFIPATYTVLNFEVDDIDAAVDQLTEQGIEMERYEGFDQDEKGIARGQGPDIAWFTDPAGNIIAVIQPR